MIPTVSPQLFVFLAVLIQLTYAAAPDGRTKSRNACDSLISDISRIAVLFPAALHYDDFPVPGSCFVTWFPKTSKPLAFFQGEVFDFERNRVVRLPRTDEWDFLTVRYARWNTSGSEVIVGDLSNAAVINARTLKARMVIRTGVTSAWWDERGVAYLQKNGKSFVYHGWGTYRLPFRVPSGGDINVVADESGKRFLVSMFTGHAGSHDLSLWDNEGFGRVRYMGYRRRITTHDLWVSYALVSGRRSGELLVVWPVQEFAWAGEVVKRSGSSRMLLGRTLLLKSIPSVSRRKYIGLSGDATAGPDRPATLQISADDRYTEYSPLHQLNISAFSKAPTGNASAYLVDVNGQTLFILWRSGRLAIVRALEALPAAAE